MKAIYKFFLDAGYGKLHGIFVASKEDVEALIESGRFVYFGEVCGKHTDVCDQMTTDNLTLVSDIEEDVAWFESLSLATGFNPFEYIAQ